MIVKKPKIEVEELLDIDTSKLIHIPPGQGIMHLNSLDHRVCGNSWEGLWVESNEEDPFYNHAFYLNSSFDWTIIEEDGSKYLLPTMKKERK